MADGTISIDVELNEKAFKASLENMGTIVKSGADLMIKSVNDLSKSFVLLPDTITSVVGSVPNIINGVINNITGKIPVMTKTGTDFFSSLINEMPDIVDKISGSAPEITNAVLNKIIDFIPDISDTGSNFFTSLISNMPDIISKITKAIPEITGTISETIAQDADLISETGFNLFCSLTQSLPLALKDIAKAPVLIMGALLEKFNGLTGQFKSVGENIVYGVWAGIAGLASWLANSVTGFFQGIINSVTDFLGISSPSKLFRDLVGRNIVLGIQSGIDTEMPGVINAAKTQMSRLASAAAQSSRLNPIAADVIGRSNTSNLFDTYEMRDMLKNRFENENAKSAAAEINVTLEPTGDIRGFFDYIRMGVKRSGYLNGEE